VERQGLWHGVPRPGNKPCLLTAAGGSIVKQLITKLLSQSLLHLGYLHTSNWVHLSSNPAFFSFFFFVFAMLGFELRSYSLSHSTSPFFVMGFFAWAGFEL
jgi:hypothetical protein